MRAPGILALALALRAVGEITIAAPAENQSGKGHSITIGEPIYVDRVTLQPGLDGLFDHRDTRVLRQGGDRRADDRPNRISSSPGINRGYNLGRVTYVSGTAGAAREAALMGIPAVAASVASEQTDYAPAAEIVRQVVEIVRKNGLEPGVFLNVNVPRGAAGAIKGIQLTRQSAADRGGAIRGAEDADRTALLLERVERADRRRRGHRCVGDRSRLRRGDAAGGASSSTRRPTTPGSRRCR